MDTNQTLTGRHQNGTLSPVISDLRDYAKELMRDTAAEMRRPVTVVTDPRDRFQIALDKTLGVDRPRSPGITAFDGLLHAYTVITGDAEVRGRLPDHVVRSKEAIFNADFPSLLMNSMNNRMAQDYLAIEYNDDKLISSRQSASDLKDQEVTTVGHFPDPPVVDLDVEPAMEPPTPPEYSTQFPIETRSEMTIVTRRAILNDNTGGLQRRIQSRARAYRRGFARFIWSFYIDNSVWQADSTAWFAAGHGNLKAEALAPLEVADAVDKLMAIVEPGSGEKLGLSNQQMDRLSLIVGNGLWRTARNINQAKYLDNTFAPNPVFHLFGADNERIVINPLEADTNNWGVLCDPGDRHLLEVRFFLGRQEPEFVLGNNPIANGALFSGDKLSFKDRFEYGGALLNFHGAVKSIVA